jgi:hypothetical protein
MVAGTAVVIGAATVVMLVTVATVVVESLFIKFEVL